MQRKIIAGNIYHVLSRGVDKRKIFLDEKDYFRFVHDLFEFNDESSLNNLTYFFHNKLKSKDIASPYIKKERKPRRLLVEILTFCLMPNHYHILLRPKSDEGLFKFMKKLNMGYAKYFNEKYKRTGALFEGRYKSVEVNQDSYFMYLPYYLHLNPLDLKFPGWRQRLLSNHRAAFRFLESYRWSSHLDYLGKKNFPSITQREFLAGFLGPPREYRENLKNWMKHMDLDIIYGMTLE